MGCSIQQRSFGPAAGESTRRGEPAFILTEVRLLAIDWVASPRLSCFLLAPCHWFAHLPFYVGSAAQQVGLCRLYRLAGVERAVFVRRAGFEQSPLAVLTDASCTKARIRRT